MGDLFLSFQIDYIKMVYNILFFPYFLNLFFFWTFVDVWQNQYKIVK